MAHWAWIEADAHISWSYEQAGVERDMRIPAVLGGDACPEKSERLEGYEHQGRIIERMEEMVADSTQPEYARWHVIYEMSAVMIGHYRLSSMIEMVEKGLLPANAVATISAKNLRPATITQAQA